MKKLKINLAVSIVLLGVLTVLFVATTFAYFTDNKRLNTSTITAGNVEIVLSEAAVKRDEVGNLVKDAAVPRIFGGSGNEIHNYGEIYPSQSIYKDPTIKNIGTDAAWVAFKVTVKDGGGDIRKIMGYTHSNHIDFHVLFSGGLLAETARIGVWNGFERVIYNDNYAMVQVGSPAKDKYEFYFFLLNPLPKGESVTVFDTMKIPAEWNNGEMQELSELVLDVEAFGVQKFNFETCFDAMTTALPEYFTFN
ncbi:MAG: hypothetical protein E7545_03020 [Ruminococcaceae bacterium]|nr:hypothetical protein [Oscillospiraceae bacterium]